MTGRAAEEVQELVKMLGLNLKLDFEKMSSAEVQKEKKHEAANGEAVTANKNGVHGRSPEEIEVEQSRLTKMLMSKMEDFESGSKQLRCSECSKVLSKAKMVLHYKEHIDNVAKNEDSVPEVKKKPRGRPKKEPKLPPLRLPPPAYEESSDDEKVFHCANPTFKIKAGEKKVRKKRERKTKVKPNPPSTGAVPEIKLSFNLGDSGVGIGVKEINLGELSGSKPSRGRKRKTKLDAFNPSSLKKKLFSPEAIPSTNPTEAFQIKLNVPQYETFKAEE